MGRKIGLDYVKLSSEISYALRHAPWEYNLELDKEGWVSLSQLICALNINNEWKNVTEFDIQTIITKSNKKRFEILDNKIRALYGHSVLLKIEKPVSKPPNTLYHGTSIEAYNKIIVNGILPQARQYVHLSVSIDVAMHVGLRRCKDPIVLEIDSKKAYEEKVNFYKGNENIWLADRISPRYISLIKGL